MKFQLAQLNIAKFNLPKDDPVNDPFIRALERVNALAEQQDGFVWRFVGSGNDALDVQAFDDPNIAVNMSVWEDMESLAEFVYRNESHLAIMRRRREWFARMRFSLALWWIPEGALPTLDDAVGRLKLLESTGPSRRAFTFRQPFPPVEGTPISPVLDECA